jgi:hypothetical protein
MLSQPLRAEVPSTLYGFLSGDWYRRSRDGVGDPLDDVVGGVRGLELEPSDSESNFSMSACEYDAPMTLVGLPDGCRSIDGRVRQNGEDERSLLPVRTSISTLFVLVLVMIRVLKTEVHTDLDHLLLGLLVSHCRGRNDRLRLDKDHVQVIKASYACSGVSRAISYCRAVDQQVDLLVSHV